MRRWQLGAATFGLLAFGCGGVSQRNGARDGFETGGHSGESDSGSGAGADTVLGAGGVASADAGLALCSVRPLGCDQSADYVDIDDTTAVRLAYPADPSCGFCNGSCQLFAGGSSNCGSVVLSLAACSAPKGVGACLDTSSSERHYTDLSGKRWTMLSLSGSSAQPNGEQAEGIVDLDLTLALSDATISRELSVHAHICADITASLVVCK